MDSNESKILCSEKLCRTCMAETDDKNLKCIFKAGQICGEITTLSHMLKECTSIESIENDGLPHHICIACTLQLSKAFLFRQKCIKSNNELHERLGIQNQNFDSEPFYIIEPEEMIDDNSNEEYNSQNNYEEIRVYVDNAIEEIDNNDKSVKNPEIKCNVNELLSVPQNSIFKTYVKNENQSKEYEEIIDEEVEQIELYTVTEEETDNDNESLKDELFSEDCSYENSKNDEVDQIEKYNNVKHKINVISHKEIENKNNIQNEQILKQKKIIKRRSTRKKIPGPPFKCEECGKILSNHSSYKYHKLLHSDVSPFLCSICGAKFKTPNAYDGHMTTHNKNNPHTCKICGKSYRQAGSLRSHMLTHTGEKPFLCGICGKGSTQKSGFKKHMLIHTGEKPFKCDICEKMFRYSSNLSAHKRAHLKKNTKKVNM